MKHIYFTVTNDLSFDQRMHRICSSLAKTGFRVTLIGRRLSTSLPLRERNFFQKRIRCFFSKGPLFYAEYNLRLFFFLLFQKADAICAIDLDTILPCLFISRFKKIKRVYDAHEFFTEMKEVRSRPSVQKLWLAIERYAVPKFTAGYTVSQGLADLFRARYGRAYIVIRNLPVLRPLDPQVQREKFILSQGAVNEARAFEYLVPAMRSVPYPLVVCGDGNFMPQLKQLIRENAVEEKILLKGMVLPEELWPITQQAALGMAVADSEGLHQFHALPNKFFDYMHAGLPQVAMDYPEYRRINEEFRVAVLIASPDVEKIADAINHTITDEKLLDELRANCLRAREQYCWDAEEKLLINFYKRLFDHE